METMRTNLCLILTLGLVSSLPMQAEDNIVLRWNDLILSIIRSTAAPPPVASRALAIIHTAMFDAWAVYDSRAVGSRLGGSLRRPTTESTPANKTAAISYAAYCTAVDLFPSEKTILDTQMKFLGYDPIDDSKDTARPAGIGNATAAALLEFRHRDGSNQLGDLNPGAYSDYTGYQPVNDVDALRDPNRWQPLRMPTGQVQRFLTPHWGQVIGFAVKSGSQFRPGPPPSYGNELYDERCED